MKNKPAFDPLRSPSLWPKPIITEKTDAQTIVSTIPGYIERAREAFDCIISRCDHAVKKGASIKLNNIERQIRVLMPTLEEWRKEVDGLIAGDKPESGLF